MRALLDDAGGRIPSSREVLPQGVAAGQTTLSVSIGGLSWTVPRAVNGHCHYGSGQRDRKRTQRAAHTGHFTTIATTISLPLHRHLHYHCSTMPQHLHYDLTTIPRTFPAPLHYHFTTISTTTALPFHNISPTFAQQFHYHCSTIAVPFHDLEAGLAKPSLPHIVGSRLLFSRCGHTFVPA